MTEFEIFEDKQKLIKTFIKYDESMSHHILKDVERKAPFESNTLLLQILLEMACKNVEDDPIKRQTLFLKMWNNLTEAKLTDELKFHVDALLSVRNQAVDQFEKELLSMKELSSSESISGFTSNDENLKIKSDECPGFRDFLGAQKPVYFEKYRTEFEEISRIGQGGFGTVWKARHNIDNVCYAVKKVIFKYKKDSDFLKVIREVKSFATLNHLNVVRYNQAWLEFVPSSNNICAEDPFGSSRLDKFSSDEDGMSKKLSSESSTITDEFNPFISQWNESSFLDKFSSDEDGTSKKLSSEISTLTHSFNSSICQWSESEKTDLIKESSELPLSAVKVMLYIQMEYCDFDLRFWMDERAKSNPLPFPLTTSEIFRDILCGVAHIHSKNVIHRDLKPQNIFYSVKTNSVKIGDFGLAALKDELNENANCSSNCGTMPYAAPEIRNNCKYDSKVDMYSLGVILIELMSESKTRMELIKILEQIFSGTISDELHKKCPQYVTLMKHLVSTDPALRFSADYVLDNIMVPVDSKEFCNFEQQKILEAELKCLKETLIEKEKRIKELETLLENALKA